MPFKVPGLRCAAPSTSRLEAAISDASTNRLLPDPQPAPIARTGIFDGLSALPCDLRKDIVRRLDLRSAVRLGSTSRQMAADAVDGIQAFLAANPHHDPLTDVGEVRTAEHLRTAVQMVMRLPYDHGVRLRTYLTLVATLSSLPASERAEAFTVLAEHASRLPEQSALPALERLTDELVSLPKRQCLAAFRAVLQAAPAAHDQLAQRQGARSENAALRALPPQARLLVRAYSGLGARDFVSLVSEVAARQTSARTRVAAMTCHQAMLTQNSWQFERDDYSQFERHYKKIVEHLAGLANGGEVLLDLADLLVSLPDPQMRDDAFMVLANSCDALARPDHVSCREILTGDISKRKMIASLLLRLANVLPHLSPENRQAAIRSLLFEATYLDLERRKSVILAIRAQAEAITPRFLELRAGCDEMIDELYSERAAGCAARLRCW